MKNKKAMINAIKHGTTNLLAAMSIASMVSLPVSAANGRELNEINSTVNVGQFQVNLNANGKIEYDKEEDGKKEVYYDFMDYQKLSQSLNTIDKNETELKKEYTRLYNLAEQNRKDIIASWNAKFAPNQQIRANGTYVSDPGTGSIKGAIDTMPRHRFSEIIVGVDGNGNVGATYPNPAWGYYNDDDGKGINLDAVREALKHTDWLYMTKENSPNKQYDMGEIHKVRYVDASGIYQWGWDDGWNARTPSVKSAIATARWMNDQHVSVTLNKDTEYHIYAINAGVNSYATNIKLKIKGADSWNIFNVEKTKLANGTDGTGISGTFTDLPSGNNLNGKVKSLSYVTNTKNYVDIKIVPKKDITVTLAISSYDGYGVAFIE